MLVLDSGAVSRLAARTRDAAALITRLRAQGMWPPVVRSSVLIECLTGGARDAPENRLLKTCDIVQAVSIELARRAAKLRTEARRGSAVDALVVATAEPGGAVLTGDPSDLRPLSVHAAGVSIHPI